MIVLGAFSINTLEQHYLVTSAQFELPRGRFLLGIQTRMRVGDLMWVKEPWCLLESRAFGPQNIREAVPGPIGTRATPRVQKLRHLLRRRTMDALALAREDSRATLEVTAITETTVSVRVHMVQVDGFKKVNAT